MNIEKINVTLSAGSNKSRCKRVTVYMNEDHKRFIEDEAHKRRTTQFQVLYDILEAAIERRRERELF